MIKNLFFLTILMSLMQMYAMENECSIIPRFPQEIWKHIAHYVIVLDCESDEECIKRTAMPRSLLLPKKYRSCISQLNVCCIKTRRMKNSDHPGYFYAESPDKKKCAIWGPITTENNTTKLIIVDLEQRKKVIDRSFNNQMWNRYAQQQCQKGWKTSLTASGNVIALLSYTRYEDADLWNNRIEIIEAGGEKILETISYRCAYDPLSIDFNLQGTQIIIHTTRGVPDIYHLYPEVRKLSAIQDHIKMLILQKFFEQQN